MGTEGGSDRMADFGGARKWARAIVSGALSEGARAVDATMGNGYDTEWLAEAVGETGVVYAFDVQRTALENTKRRLEARGFLPRARLFLQGHEDLLSFVPEKVDAAVFNLGWLPGTPHERTTRAETSLKAAEAALALLKPGGVLTVCVYPGHDEGAREEEALTAWARSLDDAAFDAVICGYANIRKRPPILIAVTRREK